ncbi:hypothetical protein ACFL0Y_03800 [Patescibacteria group bacterium]
MDIQKARKLLGKKLEGKTDQEVQEFINRSSILMNLVIDSFLDKQRKKGE